MPNASNTPPLSPPSFNTIGVFTKQEDNRTEATLKQLYEYLGHTNKVMLTDKSGGELLGIPGYHLQEHAHTIDLAIVLGGDGTLLHAARELAHHDIPLVGINLGRLGFLTEIPAFNMTLRLDELFAGQFEAEKRRILQAEIYRDGHIIDSAIALNDVVIHVRHEVRMIEFVTHINGDYVNTQRADGMIVSTPTGSTAYALSGGGPILHPKLNATVLVPICPHTLSHRPIVVSADDTIEITLNSDSRNPEARLSFDGQNNIDIEPGDQVRISPLPHYLRLLHLKDYDYYNILRAKLRWSAQL